MFDFERQFAALSGRTVLCIGDLMLDDFVYGEVSRISPEAPAPVLAINRSETAIGAAGNVACNIAALGAKCVFVGVVGKDTAGRQLATGLKKTPRIVSHLVVDSGRPTTRKTRYVSEHFATHLLRADREITRPVDATIEKALLDHALKALPKADAVVLSDYAKGTLTPKVIAAIIAAARKQKKPIVVDPKGNDYSIYRGATLITPNRAELAAATGGITDGDVVTARTAEGLRKTLSAQALLVTRSEEGMTLVAARSEPVHVPAYAVKVLDVSGAGDTVVAVLGAMLAAGSTFEEAMRAANAAAAVVVGKRGTATVSMDELRARILPSASLANEEKIVFDWSVLDARLATWRRQRLRIGFTNGCFDLLHPGHIKVLTQARAACDRLVVGLNGDASVRRLKGEGRPLQDVRARAEVLAALEAVDLVVVFDENTPLKLIRRVRPKVLVKGADYKREQVVGREIVEAQGGEIVLVDLVPGHSTSATIKRSRELKKKK